VSGFPVFASSNHFLEFDLPPQITDVRQASLPAVNPGSTHLKGSLAIALKRGSHQEFKEFKEFKERSQEPESRRHWEGARLDVWEPLSKK